MQAVSCFDEGVGFALRWLGERGCSLMLQSFVEPMIEHIRVPVFLATYCDGRRESPLVNMVTNCPLADVQELREVGNGQRLKCLHAVYPIERPSRPDRKSTRLNSSH